MGTQQLKQELWNVGSAVSTFADVCEFVSTCITAVSFDQEAQRNHWNNQVVPSVMRTIEKEAREIEREIDKLDQYITNA